MLDLRDWGRNFIDGSMLENLIFKLVLGSTDKSLSPGTYLCGFIIGAKEEEHVKNYLRSP